MFVFPMAGTSKRFSDAGYTVPKYMLEARGKSVFDHVISGFSAYFDMVPFLFIMRDVADSVAFVTERLRQLGIADARIVVLEAPTSGQAETVEQGLRKGQIAASEPLTVFNIDTIRLDFRFPTQFDVAAVDGYLEVFRGEGANWSYVRPLDASSDRVIETAEKNPISDLCCTGLYHFGSAEIYLEAYDRYRSGGAAEMKLKELYVAPLYNLLLKDGRDIRYDLIRSEQVIFCGVPAEYEAFLRG